MSKPTTDELAAVAYLTNAINPKWDRKGIETVLRRCSVEDLAAIAHAAITAAATRRDQLAPTIIAMSGPHWGTCTGEKPAVAARPWKPAPEADAAPPETIHAMRHRLGHHALDPRIDCPDCGDTA